MSIVTARVGIQQGGKIKPVEISTAFDQIRTAEQAHAAGRQLGEAIGEVFALRLQQGETLT
jgi:hypothetical protein